MAGEPGERRGAHGSAGASGAQGKGGAEPGPRVGEHPRDKAGAGASRSWWCLAEVWAAPRGLGGC